MTYETAKKLKDAGFPQATGGFYYWSREEDCNKGQLITPFYDERTITHTIKIPTLSELIKACGNEFEQLYKDAVGWGAVAEKIGLGKTPEEAVANLWLKLEKHEH